MSKVKTFLIHNIIIVGSRMLYIESNTTSLNGPNHLFEWLYVPNHILKLCLDELFEEFCWKNWYYFIFRGIEFMRYSWENRLKNDYWKNLASKYALKCAVWTLRSNNWACSVSSLVIIELFATAFALDILFGLYL